MPTLTRTAQSTVTFTGRSGHSFTLEADEHGVSVAVDTLDREAAGYVVYSTWRPRSDVRGESILGWGRDQVEDILALHVAGDVRAEAFDADIDAVTYLTVGL